MTIWAKRIQKRIDTKQKLLAWLGCIVKKAGITLKSIFCKSKSIEEVKPPLDYEKKHWHRYDWQKWVENHKDDWN